MKLARALEVGHNAAVAAGPSLQTGLVLGGGGARGAYEAGVLAYLQDELAAELGAPLRFPVITGTSVGAINGCHVAAGIGADRAQALQLVSLWKELSLEQVLKFGVSDLMRFVRETFGKSSEGGHGGLVDPGGLQAMVMRHVSWRQIARNVRSGALRGLSVSATHVASGKTTVFIQMRNRALPSWTRDAHFQARPALIGPHHALASAAIPVLFPAVKVAGKFYVDGGLRQNVPLSPALRMGAERVIVISLGYLSGQEQELPENRAYVTAPFLFGKTLNALMLDRTDADLERLRRTNALIEAGVKAYGDHYLETLAEALVPHRNQPLRYVRNILVRPSMDLGALAADYVRSGEFRRRAKGLAGAAIRRLVDSEPQQSADLSSYLLFDGGFTEQLVELGRKDARAMHAQWLAFFSDAPTCAAEAVQFEQPRRNPSLPLAAEN